MIKESILSSINPTIPIILASGSESRKVMLEDAGIKFDVITSHVDEDILKHEIASQPFEKQVIALAAAKAIAVSKQYPGHIVIGGDQMCVWNNQLFDKPGSAEKAIENLKQLSGTEHFQHSGICIYKDSKPLWEYSERVTLKMHDLSDEEIVNYVKLENPIHAAGAYKFESLGCNLFALVDGSSYTVRGMPLLPLLKSLRDLEIISLKNI